MYRIKKKYPNQFELYSLSLNKSKFVKKLDWLNSKNYLKKLKEKIVLIDYPKISKNFIKKVRKISKKLFYFIMVKLLKVSICTLI